MHQRFMHPRLLNCRLCTASMLVLAACVTGRAHAQNMPITADVLNTSAPKTEVVKAPAYDVTSVKENKSGSGMMRMMGAPDGFSGTNLSLKSYIANAYGTKPDLISGGADWTGSAGFDLQAKVAPEDVDAFKKCTVEQRRSMLQAVLADRFKLKVHTETKVSSIYELVLAKSGSKLKESAAVAPTEEEIKAAKEKGTASKLPGSIMMRPGELTAVGLPMATVASQLSNSVHRTVIDKTGLTGKYDFKLTWTPESPTGAQRDNGAADTGPDLFTAIQEQLGLRLQASKGPVETLVIDHAEKPSEN